MAHTQSALVDFAVYTRISSALTLLLACAAQNACVGPAPVEDKNPLPDLNIPAGCQPLLAGKDCFLPFPSQFFMVDDATLPSGQRLVIPDAAQIITSEGYSADPTLFRAQDGASTLPTITTLLGNPAGTILQKSDVVGIFDDAQKSIQADNTTLLIEADTGRLIPHFVDLDTNKGGLTDPPDPSRYPLVIHPLISLKEKSRYVVAIRGIHQVPFDLTAQENQTDEADEAVLVEAPTGFLRLRDQIVGTDIHIDPLRAHYEEHVFSVVEPILQQAGYTRHDLQLAWDFTTGSDAWVIGDMLQARDLALADFATQAPQVEITNVVDEPFLGNANQIRRLIFGVIVGPQVVDVDAAGTKLARSDIPIDDVSNANPIQNTDQRPIRLNGRITFPFTIVVPPRVLQEMQTNTTPDATPDTTSDAPDTTSDTSTKAHLLLFGHGFFGTQDEVSESDTTRILNATHSVGAAVDWQGMSTEDIGTVIGAIGGDVSQTLAFGERVPQGMVNWLSLSHVLQHADTYPDLYDALRVVDPNQSENIAANPEQLVYDVNQLSFFGISMGHILGGVLTAIHPNIDKAILHVGGAGFSHMMFRANPFSSFLFLLNISVPDPLDQQKVTALLQAQYDRFDPARYAALLRNQPTHILMQTGLADTHVPNFASYTHARLLDLPIISPSVLTPFGLVEANSSENGLTIFDLGFDPSFYAEMTPPDGAEGHYTLRTYPEVVTQMQTFLDTGIVIQPCNDVPCHLDNQ